MNPYAPTSLVYAASDGKHRPGSHPARMTTTTVDERLAPRDEWYADLGRNIARRRTEAGWSQARLGSALGVTAQCVCRWESSASHIDAWDIERIARLLGSIRP